MIKVFISAPLNDSGDTAHFSQAVRQLTNAGYSIINPIPTSKFVKMEDAITVNLGLLRNAEYIIRLPYKKDDVECEIEYLFALRTLKPCLTLEEALSIAQKHLPNGGKA